MTNETPGQRVDGRPSPILTKCLGAFRNAAQVRVAMRDEFLQLVREELATAYPPRDRHDVGRNVQARSRWVGIANQLAGAGFLRDAYTLLRAGIELVHEREGQLGTRLHKGTEYNDMGRIELLTGLVENGLYSLQVADEEDRRTTGGGSALARQNLLEVLRQMAGDWFDRTERLARAHGVRRLTADRAQRFLDSLDIEGLCMLALPLMTAGYAKGAQPVGQLARLNALAGLTVFLESRLRMAKIRISKRPPPKAQKKGDTLRPLIDVLGQHTRRPWHCTLFNALKGSNPSQTTARTSARTASEATGALESIKKATGPGAGRGRFAACAYLTALLVRNFSCHTREYCWCHLTDDRKWQELVAWVCAAIVQCDLDFGRYCRRMP